MDVAAPDPWENQGPGTVDYLDMAMSGIIDTIRGALEAFPELIRAIGKLVADLIGRVFKPIDDIEKALRALPAVVLLAVFALAVWWLHNGGGK